MAITLKSTWKEVARKRDTWVGPAEYSYPTRDVTVILYARYNPNERGASSTRVEQRVDIVFNDAPFNGLWCKDGGHDQGAYYQYTGASSKSWRWDAEGTFQGDGSSTYEDMFPEHWSVACSNYAATLTLSTKWDYPYYGMTSVNTQFNADVELLTPPSGGYISSVTPGTNSFTMTGGVTEIGGSSYSVELVVLNAPYTQAGIPQRYEQFHTLSATRTVSNSSSTSAGGITISPNTRYYIGVYANNGDTDLRYDGGTAVTLAPAATVSSGTVTDNTVVINYSTSADGGFYGKKIQYSLDGTTWTDGATVSTGSASSGTFTITGLSPGTTYNIQTRTTTTAGSSTGSTLTVTTTGAPFNPVLYGSVSGDTKEITELYGPAEIPTYEITALTDNTGFDADAFISKWVEEQGYMTDTPERLDIRNDDFGGHHLRVSFTHSSAVYFASWTGTYDGSLSDWGFDSTPVAGVFSYITTPALATKKITKLYGSVNGQTKLIYEAQQ